ncbi:MAG: hypothetical protein JW717_01550 [Marinilabiliaceae bacterium]|nr:hypothetical protein [Marinilabiliaceae bacterium]
MTLNIRLSVIIAGVIISGCTTYYQKQSQLQNLIVSGKFKEAETFLSKQKKLEESNNRVLYFFDRGVVNFMTGQYQTSNEYFKKADHYIEDYQSNAASEALALISNPMVKPYKPEDFESVMIYYYTTLNYLLLSDYENALVEIRRLNLQLNRLNDKYKKNKNKYTEDAFAHALMGIIYETSGDYNNAFIAYRNSIETYENVNQKLWGQSIPEQLKKDIIRAAFKTGFYDQVQFYENKFKIKHTPIPEENGSFIFFWMNGFGPVKSEWSINFTNAGYNNGWVTLINDDMGLNFPIYIGNYSSGQQNAFKDLSFLRIAFPKYQTRKPIFNNASLVINDTLTRPVEMVENINSIAYQCLKDRMVRDVATSITRLALKKAMENAARSKDDNLGTLVSIINAVTEKADTRNWQSLPYSISYSRIDLPKGNYKINLNTYGEDNSTTTFNVNIESKKTTFQTFHNIESMPPG